jgi:hypothetical protein
MEIRPKKTKKNDKVTKQNCLVNGIKRRESCEGQPTKLTFKTMERVENGIKEEERD